MNGSGGGSGVVVDNFGIWDVRKATVNKLKKNETWKQGAVFGTILSRDLVGTLTKEYAAILAEIASKAPPPPTREPTPPKNDPSDPSDSVEEEEEEEEENVVLDSGVIPATEKTSPEGEQEAEGEELDDDELEDLFNCADDSDDPEPEAEPPKKKASRTSYLTDPAAAKSAAEFNKRRHATEKHARSVNRIVTGKNLLSPRSKKRKRNSSITVPPVVQEWYDELHHNGKSGSVGLVPQPWVNAYTKGGKVWNIQKALKTPEGQVVLHFVRWQNKKKKRLHEERTKE